MFRNAIAIAAAAAAGLMGVASAHTTAIGFLPGDQPGSVTIWLGSYHGSASGSDSSIPFEGALQLTGLNGLNYSQTANFTQKQVADPAGLVWGTNLFNFRSGYDRFDRMHSWQGISFTGLQAGTYQAGLVAGQNTFTAWWYPWSTNMFSQLNIQSSDIAPVPVPAALPLFGAAVAGFAAMKRRRKAKA